MRIKRNILFDPQWTQNEPKRFFAHGGREHRTSWTRGIVGTMDETVLVQNYQNGPKNILWSTIINN
jgi:hypothetical protein